MLLKVSTPADNQIVEHVDRSALSQQAIYEMAADKSGAACHQIDPHRHCPLTASGTLARPYACRKHQFQADENVSVRVAALRRTLYGCQRPYSALSHSPGSTPAGSRMPHSGQSIASMALCSAPESRYHLAGDRAITGKAACIRLSPRAAAIAFRGNGGASSCQRASRSRPPDPGSEFLVSR